MKGNKKLQVWLPLLFSLVMILGMFFGYRMASNGGGSRGFFSGNKRSSLQEVIDLIRLRYVDAVQLDTLEARAIQEIMTELDPHSVYLPPVDLKAANEDLAGNFDGIGVQFNLFNDTVNVVYVMPGGPSDKAGLATGDKLLAVNKASLLFKNPDIDSIKNYIRGPRGSKAILTILRGTKTLELTVTRGNIPISAIDASYMMDAATGYIKLNKFTDNSYEEFMEALESLQKRGMKNLVFDIRGNGGGFMNEAVDIADEFLDGDKLVVYTEGVNSKKREYRCKRPGLFEKGKLVVLVDELSASASEALAGALQDWCRATIIGRRTFGKGLVQEQYPLSDGSAIRLTIARYYTPLGRSIQRSYEKGRKVYMDDLWDRYNSGEMLSADSLKLHQNGKKFTSICRDTLYGGDGITPTVFVPIDTSRALQRMLRLISDGKFNSYVYQYYLQNRTAIDQFKDIRDYNRQFSGAQLLGSIAVTAPDSFRLNSISAAEKELLGWRLKASLARYKWRDSGFYEVLNSGDHVVKKAMEVIGKF